VIRLVYRLAGWFWRSSALSGATVGPYPSARLAAIDAYQVGGQW